MLVRTDEYNPIIVPRKLRLHAIEIMEQENIEYRLLSIEEIPEDFVFTCVFAGKEYGANINYFLAKCEPEGVLEYLYQKRGHLYKKRNNQN